MKRWILWVPLALFATIALAAGLMLARSDRSELEKQAEKASKLVGKELPDFDLPAAFLNRAISRADYDKGTPRVLNVFASWCVPCIAEAKHLDTLARQGMPIDAVAIRDKSEDIARFLARFGDPFRNIGIDRDSSLQLALGSRGLPETFIVDGRGIIRYHKVGAINANDISLMKAEFEKAKQ